MTFLRRTSILPLMLSAAAVAGWIALFFPRRETLNFDDAFMFYRYALHFRQGLGLSWNLDGVPTYGTTSLLWQAVVLLFSFLPESHPKSLMLASWLCSGLAVAATAAGVCCNARSPALRNPWIVFPLVMLPLLATVPFCTNALTGMETMLGAALVATFAGLVLSQSRGKTLPELTGIAAAFAFLTRPESALPAVLMLLLFTRWNDAGSVKDTGRSLAVLLGTAAVLLLSCKLYFHSPMPLSFYQKSMHAYEGYARRWFPVHLALRFLQCTSIFLLVVVQFAQRTDRRLVMGMLIPTAAVMAYLCTVTQIMGMEARYFMPYFPLCVIPAFLVIDRRLSEDPKQKASPVQIPRLVLTFLLLWAILWPPGTVLSFLERIAEPNVSRYSDVHYTIAAERPLPKLAPWSMIDAVSGRLPAAMPKGSIIAASEVGLLGDTALDSNVIDMEGLNDTQIALQGFDPGRFMDRHPDFIWMPHDDYTYQRGTLMTDPRFLREYDFYAGAFDFGLAIRKASPSYLALTTQLESLWPHYYPGTHARDYLVKGVTWDHRKSVIPVPAEY